MRCIRRKKETQTCKEKRKKRIVCRCADYCCPCSLKNGAVGSVFWGLQTHLFSLKTFIDCALTIRCVNATTYVIVKRTFLQLLKSKQQKTLMFSLLESLKKRKKKRKHHIFTVQPPLSLRRCTAREGFGSLHKELFHPVSPSAELRRFR